LEHADSRSGEDIQEAEGYREMEGGEGDLDMADGLVFEYAFVYEDLWKDLACSVAISWLAYDCYCRDDVHGNA
jgi:hypothetical protein